MEGGISLWRVRFCKNASFGGLRFKRERGLYFWDRQRVAKSFRFCGIARRVRFCGIVESSVDSTKLPFLVDWSR